MGHSLHFALVQRKGGLQQCLTIAGRAGTHDVCSGRHALAQLCHCAHGGFDGIALIVCVEGIQELTLCADQSHFGGGRTGVNTQKTVAHIVCQLAFDNDGALMAPAKGFVFCLTGKQSWQSGHFKRNLYTLCQFCDQFTHRNR